MLVRIYTVSFVNVKVHPSLATNIGLVPVKSPMQHKLHSTSFPPSSSRATRESLPVPFAVEAENMPHTVIQESKRM